MFTLNFYYSTEAEIREFIYLVEDVVWREVLVFQWMICCIRYLQHTQHLNESDRLESKLLSTEVKCQRAVSLVQGLASLTQTAYEFFKVHKSISILVQKTKSWLCQRACVRVCGPWLQEIKQATKLRLIKLVLVQIWQAGVMVLQGRTTYWPVTAHKVLPL